MKKVSRIFRCIFLETFFCILKAESLFEDANVNGIGTLIFRRRERGITKSFGITCVLIFFVYASQREISCVCF